MYLCLYVCICTYMYILVWQMHDLILTLTCSTATCKIIEKGRKVFNGFYYQFTTRKLLKTVAPVSIILQVAVVVIQEWLQYMHAMNAWACGSDLCVHTCVNSLWLALGCRYDIRMTVGKPSSKKIMYTNPYRYPRAHIHKIYVMSLSPAGGQLLESESLGKLNMHKHAHHPRRYPCIDVRIWHACRHRRTDMIYIHILRRLRVLYFVLSSRTYFHVFVHVSHACMCPNRQVNSCEICNGMYVCLHVETYAQH